MAKYYAPCEDTWPKDWPREVVDSADYERLVEQYASYREAAGASIGADLSQQAIERISALEQERDDYILKQKVWEDENLSLRTQHLELRRLLLRIENWLRPEVVNEPDRTFFWEIVELRRKHDGLPRSTAASEGVEP